MLSYLISAKDPAPEGIIREQYLPTHPLNHMTTSHVTLWLFALRESISVNPKLPWRLLFTVYRCRKVARRSS
jgi:hypothetical protein